MPLDNSNYISEFNLTNPVGNVDTVSMTDDFLREIKKTIKQSFPNINKQTTITSDELNYLKAYMVRSGTSWNMQNSTLIGVAASDDATGVNPRSYNDARYLKIGSNLADVADKNVATYNLMAGLTAGSAGYNQLRTVVCNMVYNVGALYFDTSGGTNPRDRFGVGTWAQFAQGRTLVGVGQTGDSRGETRGFGLGNTGGEFQHQLNENEMPSHAHGLTQGNLMAYNAGGNHIGQGSNTIGATNPSTDYRGGNAAHNNMQPYIAVFIWQRTA